MDFSINFSRVKSIRNHCAHSSLYTFLLGPPPTPTRHRHLPAGLRGSTRRYFRGVGPFPDWLSHRGRGDHSDPVRSWAASSAPRREQVYPRCPGRAGSAVGSCTRRARSGVENASRPRGMGPGREHLVSPRAPGLPGAPDGSGLRRAQAGGRGAGAPTMGRGAWSTHPSHQRALQEELHELRHSQVHAEAAPAGSAPRGPGPPRRGTKRLWQRAADAGRRRLAPGRQRRGASPRSAASAAPRPARGWVRGGPAAPGGTMRAAAPPPSGSPGLPARRLAVPGPGDAARAGLRRVPGGSGAVRARARGGGARALVPHVGSPPRAYASAAWARSGPQHVALPGEGPAPSADQSAGVLVPACASGLRAGTGAPCPPRSPRARRTPGAQQSPTPRLWAAGRCSPSAELQSGVLQRGPARARGGRAKPAHLTCWGRSRGQVERRPRGQRSKLWVEFRSWGRDLFRPTVPPLGLLSMSSCSKPVM